MPFPHLLERPHFKAIFASPKAIRGPHPDVLMVDEAVEAKDELVLAALPMVNTSPNQLLIITSTFHKIFGIFQNIWDRADELGYYRFSWDILDVCLPFDPAIWDDPRLNREIPDLQQLKERTNGRTGDPEAWVPIENIIQVWREKSTVDWFDVEYTPQGQVLNYDFCVAAVTSARPKNCQSKT